MKINKYFETLDVYSSYTRETILKLLSREIWILQNNLKAARTYILSSLPLFVFHSLFAKASGALLEILNWKINYENIPAKGHEYFMTAATRYGKNDKSLNAEN